MALFDKEKAKSFFNTATVVGADMAQRAGKTIAEKGAAIVKKTGEVASNVGNATEKIIDNLKSQKEEIEKKGYSEKAYATTTSLIAHASALPIVRVNREAFLRKTFGDSKYLDKIIADGPQSVYSVDALRKKADEVIKNSTRKTTVTSFVAGIPSSPVGMVVAGTADITQFFAFALNLAQKIAYIFGEDQIFDDREDLISKNGAALPEEVQVRMISYIGGMMGVSGAAGLIIKTSQKAGTAIGKKVASQALTKTAWYPLLKKVGSILGYKITKKTVESVITKTVPVIGGAISGGITYATFKPMGGKLSDVFVKYLKGEYDEEMELNPEFAESLRNMEEEIIISEVVEETVCTEVEEQ